MYNGREEATDTLRHAAAEKRAPVRRSDETQCMGKEGVFNEAAKRRREHDGGWKLHRQTDAHQINRHYPARGRAGADRDPDVHPAAAGAERARPGRDIHGRRAHYPAEASVLLHFLRQYGRSDCLRGQKCMCGVPGGSEPEQLRRGGDSRLAERIRSAGFRAPLI